MDHMEPKKPSLSLLLLGYLLVFLGVTALAIRVTMMILWNQTLDWWIAGQFTLFSVMVVAGVWLWRRDNRLMRESDWAAGKDHVVYLLGKEIRRFPAPKRKAELEKQGSQQAHRVRTREDLDNEEGDWYGGQFD